MTVDTPKERSESSLRRHPWILIVVGFALLIAAWTVFILIAVRNQPESVPLESGFSEPPRAIRAKGLV